MKKLLLLSTLCLMAGQMVAKRTIILTTKDPDLKRSYYEDAQKSIPLGGLLVQYPDAIQTLFQWDKKVQLDKTTTNFTILLLTRTPDTVHTNYPFSGKISTIKTPSGAYEAYEFDVAKNTTTQCIQKTGWNYCQVTVTTPAQTTTKATEHTRKK